MYFFFCPQDLVARAALVQKFYKRFPVHGLKAQVPRGHVRDIFNDTVAPATDQVTDTAAASSGSSSSTSTTTITTATSYPVADVPLGAVRSAGDLAESEDDLAETEPVADIDQIALEQVSEQNFIIV